MFSLLVKKSPEGVMLSGDMLTEVLGDVQTHDENIFCQQLTINVAYHSHHMVEPGKVV